MMKTQLNVRVMFERPAEYFSHKEVVWRQDNGVFRYTYKDFAERVGQLAHGLQDLGVKAGDHVAVMAWNTQRHLELYFAVPMMGAVLHMVNFRLFSDQLRYVIHHAGDVAIFVDESMAPALGAIIGDLPSVRQVVVMSDDGRVPESLPGALEYETLLKGQPVEFPFPDVDEWSPAGLCYTSATTGNPKGVLYSHRALYLHSLTMCMQDMMGLSERDVSMPVVPMFHANGWGFPYTATWLGAKQVLPGPHPTPQDIARLITNEKVTVSAAVPTVWLAVEQLLENDPTLRLDSVRALIVGGSAAPRAFIERMEQRYGIPVLHAYGMTETTPLATVAQLKSHILNGSKETQYEYRSKQGMVVPGLSLRVVRADGTEVRHDGEEMGEIWLRGPWIADEYYRDERSRETFVDGWLHTGDVAAIDPEGYIRIIDRTKDLVKSGGEWISSVELENALMGHPAVAEATVIAVPHPKWVERPLACVVLKPSYQGKVTGQELIDFIAPQFAKFWLPDEVVFLDEIPKTSTGKFFKKRLREWYLEGKLNQPPA